MSLTKRDNRDYVKQVEGGGDRVLYLKMCDRLDNMRSLWGAEISEEFREKQLRETREIWLGVFGKFSRSSIYQEIKELADVGKILDKVEES